MTRRCENCIHDKVCNEWAFTSGIPFVNADTCEHYKPADVVPKKAVVDALYELKHKIHDKAVRPNNAGIDAYVSLKTFDAVLQGLISKYEQKNDGGAKYEKQ